MPEKEVIDRAHRDATEGRSPSTQAGEFVRQEIEFLQFRAPSILLPDGPERSKANA